MNLALVKLQEDLVNVVNTSQLPTEAKRLVVFEVLKKLETQASKEVAQELEAISKKVTSKETEEE